MRLLQLLRCATGHHVRSGRRSHLVEGRKESVCRGCGRKMIEEDLAWRLIGAEGASPPVSMTEPLPIGQTPSAPASREP